MCTRIFWSDNPVAKVVARTMDWAVTDEPQLWALPRGACRSGGLAGSVQWESRFASVALSFFDSGTVDGLNERGLAAHLLYLDDAGYAAPTARPVIGNTNWAQWVLDNFATVADAVDAMQELSIASVAVRGEHLGSHLALEDDTGDSAIVEPLGGRLVIHHGPEYQVMANSPTYDEQLANLHRYRPFGGDLPLPGDIFSADRFVRATYFLGHLPEPTTYSEAVAGVVHIAGNVAVPPGAPYDDVGVYPTWWTAAADLDARTFYFWGRLSPSVIWVDMERLDLTEGTPIRRLDPEDPTLQGDVTDAFHTSAGLPYQLPDD